MKKGIITLVAIGLLVSGSLCLAFDVAVKVTDSNDKNKSATFQTVKMVPDASLASAPVQVAASHQKIARAAAGK